jgi:hypothetical protein
MNSSAGSGHEYLAEALVVILDRYLRHPENPARAAEEEATPASAL